MKLFFSILIHIAFQSISLSRNIITNAISTYSMITLGENTKIEFNANHFIFCNLNAINTANEYF